MSEVYLGNPNLKNANTPIEFSQENILEFMRCKEDPVYFANKHIKIVSLDEGLVPFRMYPFQKKLISNFHENRFNICKMPRQTGKSTTVVSYLYITQFLMIISILLYWRTRHPLPEIY